MRSQLLKHWDHLRSSFWFLPSLMAIGATGLAFATVALDQSVTDEWLHAQRWAYTGAHRLAGRGGPRGGPRPVSGGVPGPR